MLVPPLQHHSAARSRFLAELNRSGEAFAVSGEEGLGRVPSLRMRGREVTLLWSTLDLAQRWGSKVAVNPRIKRFTLAELQASLLPALAEHRRLVGADWVGQGVECELDPVELAENLRVAALEQFVERVAVARQPVWTLEGSEGPARLVSRTRPDVLVVPCWSERAHAEQRCEGPWAEMGAAAIPPESFLHGRLTMFEDFGFLVSPENVLGANSLEMQPAELRRRLSERWTG